MLQLQTSGQTVVRYVSYLTGNLVLDLAALSWLAAQLLKVVINLCVHGTMDIRLALSSGGMPSSHSALVCATAMAVGRLQGFSSVSFALAAVLALVVMYDACNVRRAAGEQAKVLNRILESWEDISPELLGEELKELLGHTPLQVLMGAILGCCIGWFGVQLYG